MRLPVVRTDGVRTEHPSRTCPFLFFIFQATRNPNWSPAAHWLERLTKDTKVRQHGCNERAADGRRPLFFRSLVSKGQPILTFDKPKLPTSRPGSVELIDTDSLPAYFCSTYLGIYGIWKPGVFIAGHAMRIIHFVQVASCKKPEGKGREKEGKGKGKGGVCSVCSPAPVPCGPIRLSCR